MKIFAFFNTPLMIYIWDLENGDPCDTEFKKNLISNYL